MPYRDLLNMDTMKLFKYGDPGDPGTPRRQVPLPIHRRYDDYAPSSATPANQVPSSSPVYDITNSFDMQLELEQCIQGNELDLYSAGSVIQKGYYMGKDVHSFISSFANKYCKTITVMKNPDFYDPTRSDPSALMHGYGLMSRFAHAAALKPPVPLAPATDDLFDFNRLVGAAYNVKKDYFFPNQAPFSGLKINLSILPIVEGKTHVRLKHYFYKLLGVSCASQREIQRAWLLPGDRHHNYLHPTPFPQQFYADLKEIFLTYFEIDAPELEVQSYRSEFSELSFLANYTDPVMKKKIFKQRSNARSSYVTNTFHAQLKAALKELKDSTFVPGEGDQFGHFTYRKRDGPKQRDLPAEESMELENEPEKEEPAPVKRAKSAKVSSAPLKVAKPRQLRSSQRKSTVEGRENDEYE